MTKNKKIFSLSILSLILIISLLSVVFILNNIKNRNIPTNINNNENKITYINSEYGFSVNLPNTWQNYSILSDKWIGLNLNGTENETGNIIYIRHPKWSESNKRQDIPVMIFTDNQWNKLQNNEFHIGAAPINPTLLTRNQNYFFALPARYNFAFLNGYEEVENILNSNPVFDNNWLLIKKEILNCNIKEITQLHSGLVSIKLKNNSRIEGYQPKIDNMFSLVNCKNKITFITE